MLSRGSYQTWQCLQSQNYIGLVYHEKSMCFFVKNSLKCMQKMPVTLRRRHLSASQLHGIFPPIVTPFSEDASLDVKNLSSNMKFWEKTDFAGYVVMGSNGENVLLSHQEKLRLIKEVRSCTQKPLIAGTGCESTKDTVQLTRDAAKEGADAALVVTPSYYKLRMSKEALLNHYIKIADVSSIPIILYSVPANTGVDLGIDIISELSTHPNIIGLKDSDGNITKLTTVVKNTIKNEFRVLAGSASFLLPSYIVGCVGGVCALANVLGDAVCELEDLWKSSQLEKALELQRRLVGPNTAVTKTFGVAGLKYSMDIHGLYGGIPRLPLLPLTKEEQGALREVFSTNGFNTKP